MVSPYATALELGRPAPKYVNAKHKAEDGDRIQAYQTYDDIYYNIKEVFDALLRTDDDPKSRRRVSFGRAIVEACNRYLGKDLTVSYEVPLDSTTEDPAEMVELQQWLEALMLRENFANKFAETKRTMLRRGDGFMQISADPSKPEGSRIRITLLDGSQYFRIQMGRDPERLAGVYIVTLLTSPDGQTVVAQRERYQRILTPEDVAAVPGSVLGGIFYQMEFFEEDGWDDRFPLTAADLKRVQPPQWINWGTPVEGADPFVGFMLPAAITSIPVYHFRNSFSGPYGFSVLQGLETLLAGIVQNYSDEDQAMALTGIGVYWTDSGAPKDANGKETDWVVAPGSVMELDSGRKFGRVEGVTSVEPMQDHIGGLKDSALEIAGVPDVAVGAVDVKVAESGVALGIKMAPILGANKEREDGLVAVLTQMIYDLLNGWAPAYEGRQPVEGRFIIKVSFGDSMPQDRAALLEEVKVIIEAKIADGQWARDYLTAKLGFVFPSDVGTRMAAAEQAALDAEGARLDAAASALPAGGGAE